MVKMEAIPIRRAILENGTTVKAAQLRDPGVNEIKAMAMADSNGNRGGSSESNKSGGSGRSGGGGSNNNSDRRGLKKTSTLSRRVAR
jgi:uncharacterized membrane protein YgcG